MITDHGPVPCWQNVGKPADAVTVKAASTPVSPDVAGRAETLVDDTSAPAARHAV